MTIVRNLIVIAALCVFAHIETKVDAYTYGSCGLRAQGAYDACVSAFQRCNSTVPPGANCYSVEQTCISAVNGTYNSCMTTKWNACSMSCSSGCINCQGCQYAELGYSEECERTCNGGQTASECH